MKKFSRYYNKLSDIERLALNTLATTLATALLYFLFLNPSRSYYYLAKENYSYNKNLSTWIRDNKSKLKPPKKTFNNKFNKNLLQTISTSAEASDIELSRIQPESATEVRVWLHKAEFSVLIDWLSTLAQKEKVSITSISIDKTSKTGIVNTQFFLRRN